MELGVLLFGIAREIAGASKIHLDISPGTSVGEVKKKLVHQFPDFNKLRSLNFAVNEEYVKDDFTLHESDELVIIPPVSGG